MQGLLYIHPKTIIEKLEKADRKVELACFLERVKRFLTKIDDKPRIHVSSLHDWEEYKSVDNESAFEAIINKIDSTTDASALMQELNKITGKFRVPSLTLGEVDSNLQSLSNNGFYYGLVADRDSSFVGIEDCQKVNSENALYNFHVSFLKNVPESENSYFERCKDFFTFLEFDEGFQDTLKTLGEGSHLKGIVHFSKSATEALVGLDQYEFTSYTPRDVFVGLQRDSGFICSEQGQTKRGARLKRTIRLPDGSSRKINCEYHFKLPHSRAFKILCQPGLLNIQHLV